MKVFAYMIIISFLSNIYSIKYFGQNEKQIQILSWNIQMLPDLYSPFSKQVRKKQKTRLPEIIKYLDSSSFDVVILQEVFDIQMTNRLKKRLISNYQFIQMPIKKGIGIKLSNGIMILSKHPMKYIKHIKFAKSIGNDRMAQKGCILIKILVNDQQLLIAGTHLNSISQKIRNSQYLEIKNEIILPYKTDSLPFIIAGDLNTNKQNESFFKMISLFDLKCSPLIDNRPYTYDSQNSWNPPNYNVWIDYLLHNLKKHQILDQYIIRPTMYFNNKVMDLADHYGIALKIAID